jgi:hypothetical protein
MIVIEVEKQSLNLIDSLIVTFLVSYSNGHGKNFRAIIALIYLSDRVFNVQYFLMVIKSMYFHYIIYFSRILLFLFFLLILINTNKLGIIDKINIGVIQ